MHHKAKGLKNNASPLQKMSYNKVYIFTQNKKQETTQNPSLKTIIYNKHANFTNIFRKHLEDKLQGNKCLINKSTSDHLLEILLYQFWISKDSLLLSLEL